MNKLFYYIIFMHSIFLSYASQAYTMYDFYDINNSQLLAHVNLARTSYTGRGMHSDSIANCTGINSLLDMVNQNPDRRLFKCCSLYLSGTLRERVPVDSEFIENIYRKSFSILVSSNLFKMGLPVTTFLMLFRPEAVTHIFGKVLTTGVVFYAYNHMRRYNRDQIITALEKYVQSETLIDTSHIIKLSQSLYSDKPHILESIIKLCTVHNHIYAS